MYSDEYTVIGTYDYVGNLKISSVTFSSSLQHDNML